MSQNIENIVSKSLPQIIQGGMGVGVSDWNLAKTVSQNNALGVVSGTALESVLLRRLQLGDKSGHMKHAMEQFPFPEIAEQVYDKYFINGGKNNNEPFKLAGMYSANTNIKLEQLTTLGNFVEVFLAKEGHNNPVGINYLEKIQMAHLPAIYGAMLADVDYVIMGAGVPLQIPGILDSFVTHKPESYNLFVEDASKESKTATHFNPKEIIGSIDKELKRPDFLGIISSATLATVLTTRASGNVNGFVIEEPTAGGHNAPPRGKFQYNEKGEPLYGPKDIVDVDKIKSFGLPFWIGGSYGSPEKLKYALEAGATGIQVGTLFSLTNESGLDKTIKENMLKKLLKEHPKKAKHKTINIYTDPVASPTGFPFKVASLEGTHSESEIYDNRKRICDLGYLRTPFEKEDGTLGYRCPAEPFENYVKKGGALEDTLGRKCLCNGLLANIGLPQVQKDGITEKPIITAGNDINEIKKLLGDKTSYSAVDVLDYLRQ